MADWFADVSFLEVLAVVFAIVYLLFAIRQNSLCWPAALISVTLSLVLFYDARLYMEALLQVFYIAMAIYGWYQWRFGGAEHAGISIRLWSAREHAFVLVLIALSSLAFGGVLSRTTNAALPYVDSFTTVAAIVTTYMVAKKILENWIYWFVIDAVSVYLYSTRGLTLYAALFVFYLVLIIVGFRRWLVDWRSQAAAETVAQHG